jgi:hypothetical protein
MIKRVAQTIIIRKAGYEYLSKIPMRMLEKLPGGRYSVIAGEHSAFTIRAHCDRPARWKDGQFSPAQFFPKNCLTGAKYILDSRALEVS